MSALLSSCAGIGGGGAGPTAAKPKAQVNGEKPGVFKEGSVMEAIQKRGKLVVGLPLDLLPFAGRDPNTGSISGFDVEIAKQVATGIFGSQIEGKIDYVELDPRDRELAVQQNRVDIAVGRYEITVARKRFIDFAGPYYTAHEELVYDGTIKRDNQQPALLDFNNGQKICSIRTSTNLDGVRQTLPGADTTTVVNTVNECAALLSAKKVDAIAGDHVDLQSLIKNSNNRFRSTGQDFLPAPYGIGVKKGATDFRQYLNDRISNQISSQWDEIYARTIGPNSGDRKPAVDRY